MSSAKQICFNANTLLTSTIILLVVIIATGAAAVYFITVNSSTSLPSQPALPRAKPVLQRFLRNSYNRPYRDQESIFDTDNANKVGYIFNGSGVQYPLYQYSENREYKYFILDDSRNGNKIEIPNPNRRDIIYDGDKIFVPEFLEEMNIRIYPIVNTIFSSRI
jgi:hypothetical protein